MIEIKTASEIEAMKPAGRFVAGILKELKETTKVGTNLLEIDEFVHKKIVNTANPYPICASGTDLAIYEAAGKEKLLAERANIGKIARGDIAVTGAYNLKAKYIIHTVGPVWTDGLHHEFEILKHFMESLLC